LHSLICCSSDPVYKKIQCVFCHLLYGSYSSCPLYSSDLIVPHDLLFCLLKVETQRNICPKVTICNDLHILIRYSLKHMYVNLHTPWKWPTNGSLWGSFGATSIITTLLDFFSSTNLYHLHFIGGIYISSSLTWPLN
jgi:hypothetical protein